MLIKLRNNFKCQKGFTLVELMVVIAVIGILVAIAVPKFTSASATARGAKVQADLRTVDSAIAIAIARGTYTAGSGDGTGALPAAITSQLSGTPTPPATFTVGANSYAGASAYSINASDRAVVKDGDASGKTAEGL